MEKKKLTDVELLQLELYNVQIERQNLAKLSAKREREKTELHIANHQLAIENLRNRLVIHNGETTQYERKIDVIKEERNTYIRGLVKKYNLNPDNFGYDDVTGEIFENEIQE